MANLNFASLFVQVIHLTIWLVVLATLFATVEKIWALHRAPFWRAGMVLDLLLYFVSSVVPAAVMAIPLAWLLTGLRLIFPPAWQTWSSEIPTFARYAITFLVAELGSYWGHRWTHESRFLWRFHSLHHSAEHMDWLVNTRAHPVDMIFTRMCALVPISLLGLANPSNGTNFAVVATLVTTVWGFVIHANVRLRLGHLERCLASPFFHHWHHTRTGAINRNYAATLPMLDRIFGTAHVASDWPAAYGISEEQPTPSDQSHLYIRRAAGAPVPHRDL